MPPSMKTAPMKTDPAKTRSSTNDTTRRRADRPGQPQRPRPSPPCLLPPYADICQKGSSGRFDVSDHKKVFSSAAGQACQMAKAEAPQRGNRSRYTAQGGEYTPIRKQADTDSEQAHKSGESLRQMTGK